MIFRHPNGNHTYPKTESLEYSLAFSHNSYSYPLTLLVLYYGYTYYGFTSTEASHEGQGSMCPMRRGRTSRLAPHGPL
eukprot:scaffold104524_cov36-Phaeocystis_antarctica.AAC.1